MNKKHCQFCQKTESKNWIVENHYLGKHGQILKKVNIGCESEEKRKPINIIYYCSVKCMERQIDKEDEELWAKGNCPVCQKPLAIINENCQDLQHKKEACLLPIDTPDCLKK